MVSAIDVASYVVEQCGTMTAMKLQKLVYYSQAWSLVWDEEPLFKDKIEAWANGPVVPGVYREHATQFKVDKTTFNGNPSNLNEKQIETIDAITKYYGKKSSQQLSDLTHAESPWKDARGDLKPGQRGDSVISHASMSEYYGSL